MRSSIVSAAVFMTGLGAVSAQTFTDCNPLEKTCPSDKSLGSSLYIDFTSVSELPDTMKAADGTTISFDKDTGAQFQIKEVTNAPTIGTVDYIFFGRVSASIRASPGTGTVSSFILESDDLDEIDWEWIGADDANVQTNFFGKGNTTSYDRGGTSPVATPLETFHNYTIVWTSEKIDWIINDSVVRTLNYGDASALGGKNFPQTPMRVKMGSWVGCASEADNQPKAAKYWTCQWAGGPIDVKSGPYNMNIQWVEIENFSSGCEYTYSDRSGSFESITQTGTCGKGSSSFSSGSSSSSSAASSSSTSSSKSGSSTLVSSTVSSTATSTATDAASAASGTSSSSGSSTSNATATSSSPAQVSANAGSSLKPSHQYGVLDLSVMGLGLLMGYLVM